MKQRILIELDAILDTRLATIALMDPLIARDMVNNEKYYKRVSDEFNLIDPRIDNEAYKEAYRKRDVTTLMGSRPTGMVLLIAEHIRDMERRLNQGTPDITSLAVDVNLYPYVLQDDEIEALIASVKKVCNIMVNVEHVFIPHEKLTTLLIKNSQWANIYYYNFMEWDSDYLSKCEEAPVSVAGTAMIIPELVTCVADIQSDKTIMPATGKRIQPYHALSILLAETICLQPIDCHIFSLIQFR